MKKLCLIIFCAVLLTGTFNVNAQKGKPGTAYYPQVTITHLIPGVTGDNLSLPSNLYRDYNLPGSDPCVSAFGSPSFIMYPQKSADCAPARSFRLYIPAGTYSSLPPECQVPGVFTLDPNNGLYFANAWRMNFSNLYGTASRREPVIWSDAKFSFWCGSTAYAIIAWESAQQPVKLFQPQWLSADGRKRNIANFGPSAKAKLWKPQDGGFVALPIPEFPFSFDITTQFVNQ